MSKGLQKTLQVGSLHLETKPTRTTCYYAISASAVHVSVMGWFEKGRALAGLPKSENGAKPGLSPGNSQPVPQSKVAVSNGTNQPHTNGTVLAAVKTKTAKSSGKQTNKTAQPSKKTAISAQGEAPWELSKSSKKPSAKAGTKENAKAVVKVQAAEQDNLREVSTDDLPVVSAAHGGPLSEQGI